MQWAWIRGKNMSDVEERRLFSDYMEKFEQKVMIPCISEGLFKQKMMVSTRIPKLRGTAFGEFVGPVFKYDGILTFNYYGLTKVSTGFEAMVQTSTNKGLAIKAIESSVVYFAAIKMKNIADLAPELVVQFVDFKDYLVSLRDFPSKP